MEHIQPYLDRLMDDEFKWQPHSAKLLSLAPVWVTVAFLYLPVMFGLQRISGVFKPFRVPLRLLWGVWNLVTAVFSAIGFVTILPAFIETLKNFDATCSFTNPHISVDGRIGGCAGIQRLSRGAGRPQPGDLRQDSTQAASLHGRRGCTGRHSKGGAHDPRMPFSTLF